MHDLIISEMLTDESLPGGYMNKYFLPLATGPIKILT